MTNEERIAELKRDIKGTQGRIENLTRGLAEDEAELARLRAEPQGWRVVARRDTAMPGPFTDWWGGGTFWSVPDSLVAHIEAEATAPLRAQLAEAEATKRMDQQPWSVADSIARTILADSDQAIVTLGIRVENYNLRAQLDEAVALLRVADAPSTGDWWRTARRVLLDAIEGRNDEVHQA